jgi:oligopeptidase B
VFCATAFSLIFAASCKNDSMNNTRVKAPIAEKIPTEIETHGDIRIDNYFWMRLSDQQKEAENKDDQTVKVVDYLNAENIYYDEITAHTNDFQESLFEEMKSRIKEDDESVPYKKNGYYYITKYKKGEQYPIFTRKKESLESQEKLLFDVNDLAKDHDYFQLGGLNVSSNNELVAFAVDTISRRQYVIQVKNLITGVVYNDVITNTTGGSVWANDNKTLFYTKKDPVSLRSYKVFKHVLGTDES